MACLPACLRAQVLVLLLDKAIAAGSPSGVGADIPLIEVAVRALARIALSAEGRHAITVTKGDYRCVLGGLRYLLVNYI